MWLSSNRHKQYVDGVTSLTVDADVVSLQELVAVDGQAAAHDRLEVLHRHRAELSARAQLVQ